MFKDLQKDISISAAKLAVTHCGENILPPRETSGCACDEAQHILLLRETVEVKPESVILPAQHPRTGLLF